MGESASLVYLLRNVSVRDLVRALLRDGFVLRRQTRSGGRIYTHPDGRSTTVDYHHGSDTLTRKTLGSILNATGWTPKDAEKLGLL